MTKNKPKCLIAEWHNNFRIRAKLDAYFVFPFRLDIPETQSYNNCRAIIPVSDTSWMIRPIKLPGLQLTLVNMSRSASKENIFTLETKAPYFVFHEGQDSDFYFRYNWNEQHFELISVTPTQELLTPDKKPSQAYRFGLAR